jgi:hypothetical protein
MGMLTMPSLENGKKIVFFVAIGFELRASCFLGRCSIM